MLFQVSVSALAPSGIIYADVGALKTTSSPRILEPKIIYSTITGTINPVTKRPTNPGYLNNS